MERGGFEPPFRLRVGALPVGPLRPKPQAGFEPAPLTRRVLPVRRPPPSVRVGSETRPSMMRISPCLNELRRPDNSRKRIPYRCGGHGRAVVPCAIACLSLCRSHGPKRTRGYYRAAPIRRDDVGISTRCADSLATAPVLAVLPVGRFRRTLHLACSHHAASSYITRSHLGIPQRQSASTPVPGGSARSANRSRRLIYPVRRPMSTTAPPECEDRFLT